jgi:hypothetical protein
MFIGKRRLMYKTKNNERERKCITMQKKTRKRKIELRKRDAR